MALSLRAGAVAGQLEAVGLCITLALYLESLRPSPLQLVAHFAGGILPSGGGGWLLADVRGGAVPECCDFEAIMGMHTFDFTVATQLRLLEGVAFARCAPFADDVLLTCDRTLPLRSCRASPVTLFSRSTPEIPSKQRLTLLRLSQTTHFQLHP